MSVVMSRPVKSSQAYGRMSFGFAGVLAVAFIVQLAVGAYATAVITVALGLVIALRGFGVIPATGWRPKDDLGVCPRCGQKMLAPDVDKSGVRHCWGCGDDVPDDEVGISA